MCGWTHTLGPRAQGGSSIIGTILYPGEFMKELTLANLLYTEFDIKPTSKHVVQLCQFLNQFETRPGNAEAFGSSLLGVHKAHFLTQDEQQLFTIFNIEYSHFRKIAHSATAVDPTHIVASNPYNLLTVWLIHLFLTSKLPISEKNKACNCLLNLMQYRFFTSAVNYNLPHGANEGVMQYTIDNLSNKFDIKVSGSWKALIHERSARILGGEGIHLKTFKVFGPDKAVLYSISDIQTRIRRQVVTIIHNKEVGFWRNYELGNTSITTSMMDTINGDSIMRVVESSMDSMTTSVSQSATNLAEFLDYSCIRIAVGLANEVTEDLFINVLTRFSSMAEAQLKNRETKLIKGSKSKPIFVGYELLLSTIIQKTYRLCRLDRELNMSSKAAIITKAMNIYRSSRISDIDVINIKNSVAYFIDTHSQSKREATNSSMRIAFILYILLLSFNHLK